MTCLLVCRWGSWYREAPYHKIWYHHWVGKIISVCRMALMIYMAFQTCSVLNCIYMVACVPLAHVYSSTPVVRLS